MAYYFKNISHNTYKNTKNIKAKFCICLFALIAFSSIRAAVIESGTELLKRSSNGSAYSRSRGGFTENKGQYLDMKNQPVNFVLFRSESANGSIYITDYGLSYVIVKPEEEQSEQKDHDRLNGIKGSMERVDMVLKGATIKKAEIITEEEYSSESNFFNGVYPQNICHVKTYGKVTIKNIYPGIDWVLYETNTEGMKYDFILHPGANPANIRLFFKSSQVPELKKNGELVISTRTGGFSEKQPYSYLMNTKKEITSSFIILNSTRKQQHYETEIGFQLNNYVDGETVVIDPQLVWSTIIGGGAQEGSMCTEVDASGNLFTAGYTASSNFPVFNAGTYFQGTLSGFSGFIMKFSPAGALMWSSYYANCGGFEFLTITNNGDVYGCTSTASSTFAVMNGGGYYQGTFSGQSDAAIIRFDNGGNLLWATYYGASAIETACSLTHDANGNVFLTGTTTSTNLPVQNAGGFFQTNTFGPNVTGFIAKFSPSNTLLWGTTFPGSKRTIAKCDNNGNLFVVGEPWNGFPTFVNPGGGAYYQTTWAGSVDILIAKFNAATNLVWSTYFGGNNTDEVFSVHVDKSNNLIFGGNTSSTNLPFINGGGYFQAAPASTVAPDCYLVKFNNSGVMQWGTCLGGTREDRIYSNENIDTDSCGNIYIGTETKSRNFPLMAPCDGGYYDNSLDTSSKNVGEFADMALTRFTPGGQMTWSTLYGGNAWEVRSNIAVDRVGNVYMVGEISVQGYTWNPATYTFVNLPGAYFDNIHNGSDDDAIIKFGRAPSVYSFSYSSGCSGGSPLNPQITGSLPSGGTYIASPGITVNPITGQVNPANSAAGTYTVTYFPTAAGSNTCSCFSGQQAVTSLVTVQPGGTLVVTGQFTICAGTKITFSVSGANTYSWSTGSVVNTMTVSPQINTSYVVTGTTTSGCILSKNFQIKVNNCNGLTETNITDSNLLIIPNPNNGEFTISGLTDDVIDIMDETGRLVKTVVINNENGYKCQVSGLAAGVYLLYTKKEGRRMAMKVIVK